MVVFFIQILESYAILIKIDLKIGFKDLLIQPKQFYVCCQ